MRALAASLVGNPLPEHIKVTVFMDGLKVGPSRTQLFRVHANTMEEAIQIALQEEYSHRQARTPTDKFADAFRESEGRGQISVRLADGTVVNVLAVRMDLAVKFEDFDSTESFYVLDMDKCDLILGMPCSKSMSPGSIDVSKPLELADPQSPTEHWLIAKRVGLLQQQVSNAESRPAVWASTVAVSDSTDQAGNIGPQAAEAAEEDAESASGVGNIVPHKVEETEKKIESAAGVSSVGNVVPRGVKKTSTRAEVSLSTSHADNQVPHSESETPPARPVEDQYHVFDGVSGRHVRAGVIHLEALSEVSALLNLEELSMKDFLAELNTGEIMERVLLKPETSPEDLNSSSVMDEDVLEGFTKQRAARLGILKNPDDPVYPLVKEFSDVCEVIDAFFPEKAKSGMVRESKTPHSTPCFCVRKPNGKWCLVHAYSKLNNAAVPAQTLIPRKDVLMNNMSGCTIYSAVDLVDGYYQILMRESDIPVTAASTPSGMLVEWLVMS
ncbi:Pol protein [Phytophthora palmivora]|uniref:Pol protein n=1 Tax=Phytophthora palmivora TaxID=4796 RepID=A0A2P4YMN1_9STRA|nr:Pol protein [Phytophthora palmivora]